MASTYLQRSTGTPTSQTKFTVSVWVKRSGLNPSGNNMDTSNFVGNAPGSNSNGTGSNLDISDLKGDMSNSTKNSYSINMADYGDPNNQGVTPANSGRTTSVPG